MSGSACSVYRLSHRVIVGAPHLMDMWYTPGELAEELKVSARTIRDWARGDLPHRKDEAGRLWINGVQFAAWADHVRANHRRAKLQEGEAYCLKCKGAVEIHGAQKSRLGKMQVLTGQCPRCGTVVNRGMARDQSN